MKRVMVLVLMSMMVLSIFAGCSKTDPKTGGNSTETTSKKDKEPDKKDDKLVVGFAQIGAESGWRTAETGSIKDTCANDPNVELKFSDAQQKQENQIKAIRNFIVQKVDVIGLAPVVESGWETVLGEAKEAGIPVILVDRGINVEDESLYATFIGSDFAEEGKKAADFLIEHFGAGKTVNIVELQGTVGASAATDRKTGFEEGIAVEAGYTLIESQTAEFTRSKGKEVMEAFLKSKGEEIQAVYAHNDDMALGAIQAIEEYGLVPGKDIIIVSVDGVKDAFVAIKDGKLNCTVECNPLLGPQFVQAAKDLKAGKTLERWIKSDEDVYYGQKAIDALDSRQY